jgi:Fe-S oxidoreductase
LIGVEPSAILTFRDEYPDLASDDQLTAARELAKNVFMIDEFIAREISKGAIKKEQFTAEKRHIKLHGHCQQKALSSVAPSVHLLSLPENYTVETIPSGCCGMAGSFGYEKEHYDLSMQIGELVLFPTVRKQGDDVIIAERHYIRWRCCMMRCCKRLNTSFNIDGKTVKQIPAQQVMPTSSMSMYAHHPLS